MSSSLGHNNLIYLWCTRGGQSKKFWRILIYLSRAQDVG